MEKLRSLDSAEILSHLDLSRPGLEAAAKAQQASDRAGALRALLAYYRGRYPLPTAPAAGKRNGFAAADRVVKHVFQWGPYDPADYSPSVHWEWDPRGDIEWVAEEEEGYFAWEYGRREPRTAFRYRHVQPAPAAFLSIVFPYRGTEPPTVSAKLPEAMNVGDSRVEVQVEAAGIRRLLGRDVDRGEAWCRR